MTCPDCGKEAEQFNEWDEPPVDWYFCKNCILHFSVKRQEQFGLFEVDNNEQTNLIDIPPN